MNDNKSDQSFVLPDPERRALLRQMRSAVVVTALAPGLWLASGGTPAAAGARDPVAASYGLKGGPFDVDLRLRAQPGTAKILPGTPSDVWRYTAELLKGPANTLAELDESYPGPVIRLRRGQRFRARLENSLPEDTTVHWHGLHVPSDVDGQPRLPIKPGETMTVAFDVVDRAGLYWYHPHSHGPDGGRVGFQSYAGLSGALVIEDEVERALGLPSGDQEMVLILQDRRFDDNNALSYLGDGMGNMMTRMHGFLGDRILVNGRPDAIREVATRPYRLRIVNGSNSRIYKLAWSDGGPVTVIGTDGGLLAAPQQRPYVVLAPGQRTDLWADFSNAQPDTDVQLVSESYQAGMMEGGMMGGGMMGGGMMGGGMMGSSSLPAGARFTVLSLRVARREYSNTALPERLAENIETPRIKHDTPVRRFELGMIMMQGFAINGRRFEGATVADDEIVHLGETEIWEFVNNTMMPHPMHVHGLQFSVIGRDQFGSRRGWEGLDDGLVDAGLHDTVLVLPGERVRIALTFEDFEGLYIYHCHNMEHEDNGMMRYYRVEA